MRTQSSQHKINRILFYKNYYGLLAKKRFEKYVNVLAWKLYFDNELRELSIIYQQLNKVVALPFATANNETIFEGVLNDGSLIYFTATEKYGVSLVKAPRLVDVTEYEVTSSVGKHGVYATIEIAREVATKVSNEIAWAFNSPCVRVAPIEKTILTY